jgi:glycosyltransferase involved in cell wall biosynthesis
MRIAVVAPSGVPFVFGGAERHFQGLVQAINEGTEHVADLIKLPSPESTFREVVSSYRAFRRLDVSHFDRVVTVKYPAWIVEHPDQTVWMNHTLRGLYDTYHLFGLPARCESRRPVIRRVLDLVRGRPDPRRLDEVFDRLDDVFAAVGPDEAEVALPSPLAREVVHFLDRVALSPPRVRRHAAVSATVARRPGYFPAGVVSDVIHCPTSLPGLHPGPYTELVSVSRLDGPKRVDLVVRAMAHVRADVRLVVAGTGPEAERLGELAAGDPRIELVGHVPDDQLVELYAGALAVPFVPLDEDHGLVTLEAGLAGKPVVTCPDSGGPTELVVDGRTGLVRDPTPEALGAGLERLARDPDLARRLGEAARAAAERVTWPDVVARLLALGPAPAGSRPPSTGGRGPRAAGNGERACGDGAAGSGNGGIASGATGSGASRNGGAPPRRRIVVLSTYPVHPRQHGGQLRCAHLYRGLTERYDVSIVSLAAPDGRRARHDLGPGFDEWVVARSPEHLAREHDLSGTVGWFPITDLAATAVSRLTPELHERVGALAGDAAAIVLAHPYLLPVAERAAPGVPLVYDAHNAEADLKAALLPETPAGRSLVHLARAVESAAVGRAALVVACSDDDVAALARAYLLDERRAVVIPNGVDTGAVRFVDPADRAVRARRWLERVASLSGGRPDPALALFLGSWHTPNIEAAHRLLEMAPRLPDVHLVLAGDHTRAFGAWRIPARVSLLGVVTETGKAALLGAATVALNPMERGSGTNLKLVEYCAAGVPVVSTPLGARGFAPATGAGGDLVELAPLPRFAEAVAALVADPERRARRAVAARRHVEEHLDWTVLGGRLLEAVERAVVAVPAGR